MKLLCILLFIVATIGLSDTCYKAFSETNFSGRNFGGCPTGCEAIANDWRQHFKSVNPGGCLRLFEQKTCTGRSIDLKAGTRARYNLRSIGWMKTGSLRNC